MAQGVAASIEPKTAGHCGAPQKWQPKNQWRRKYSGSGRVDPAHSDLAPESEFFCDLVDRQRKSIRQ